jgi:hypothetical protein
LYIRREEAEGRPKSDFQPKTLADLNVDAGSMHGSDGVNGKQHKFTPFCSYFFNQNIIINNKNTLFPLKSFPPPQLKKPITYQPKQTIPLCIVPNKIYRH